MNGPFPELITIGEKYGPAMEITEQADADAYFERCVEHNLRCAATYYGGTAREEAERIERVNLGYFAGYYSHETRQRVERLFRCAHPIFGPAGAEPPRPETVAALGLEAGKRIKSGGAP